MAIPLHTTPVKTGLTLPITLLLLLNAAAALAERPVVFVISTAGNADDVAEVVWQLREQISLSEQLASREPAGLLDGAADQSIASAKRTFRRGIDAFSAFELDDATRKLQQASLVLAGWQIHHKQAVKALSLLGQTYSALGETAMRDRTWQSLLTLQPDYRLTDSTISPSTRNSFTDAKRAADGTRRNGSIAVGRRRRMPTAVFLNGRFVSMAPVTLDNLSRTTHHIRLSSDGFKHEHQFIDLGLKREKRLSYTGSSTARRQLYSQIRRRLPSRVYEAEFEGFMRELKALVVSDQAILVSKVNGRYEAALFDLNRERRASRVRVPIGIGSSEDIARTIFKDLYGQVDVRAPTAPRAQPVRWTRNQSRTTEINWWVWGGITAGLVAAIAIPIAVWPESSSGLKSRTGTGAVIFRY